MDLRAQHPKIALQTPREVEAPTAAEIGAVTDQLERVIAEAEPPKAKALLWLLIEELRVNGRKEILPTYRIVTPAVCAMSEKVEAAGIEPAQHSQLNVILDIVVASGERRRLGRRRLTLFPNVVWR